MRLEQCERDWCFFLGHSFAFGSISMDAIYSSVWFVYKGRCIPTFFIIFWAFFLNLEHEGQ